LSIKKAHRLLKIMLAMLRQQLIAEKLRLDSLRAQVIFDESQRLKKRLGITAELDATYY